MSRRPTRETRVPFTCAQCGNVEVFAPHLTLREVALTPCIRCGAVGKISPRLTPAPPGLSARGDIADPRSTP